MKLENMILVVENYKEEETNFLLGLEGYMEAALRAWEGNAAGLAGAVRTLYQTKAEGPEWSHLYFREGVSMRAAFCSREMQLRGFLSGAFNRGKWAFDVGRCPKECLGVLKNYNLDTDGRQLSPYLHHEQVGHVFQAGETLHNLNGNDYRVLAVLSPENLLLLGMADGQAIVGRGVRMYERYPKGERPDDGSVVIGVEWDHGVYLGNDITRLDFDILRQEYGEAARAEGQELSALREAIRRDFRMQGNVARKERLPLRVREMAKNCMEQRFGTSDPEVFAVMLDKGVYDGMYQAKEPQKKITGQAR